MIRRRLRVTGRVQGVSFRDWTAAQARALGLAGWVRNRADGSVEMVVEGAEEAVAAMTARAGEGPPASRVAAVTVEEEGSDEPLDGFARRPTG